MSKQDSFFGPTHDEFLRRVLIVLGLTAAFVIGALLMWMAASVLLVAFAGILLAVLLHSAADWVRRVTGAPYGWSLALVGVILLSLLGVVGWFVAAEIAEQMDEFARALRSSWSQVEQQLRRYEWGAYVLESSAVERWLPSQGSLIGGVTGMFSTALGVVVNLVVVLFVGIYLAVDPGLYQRGLLHLVPVPARGRAGQTLTAVGATLRWWLLGRLLNMAIVGALTAVGLWLLDIPLVLPLTLIAFTLDFVPYIGPILSAIPAILIGATLQDNPMNGAYVALLYLGIQTLESYLIQPLIQHRAVEMPPALLIVAQIVMGLLFGAMGVIVATPLIAVGLVVVKMLYIEDALGDQSVPPKAERAAAA